MIVRGIFLKGIGLELLWPQAAALAAWGSIVLVACRLAQPKAGRVTSARLRSSSFVEVDVTTSCDGHALDALGGLRDFLARWPCLPPEVTVPFERHHLIVRVHVDALPFSVSSFTKSALSFVR